MKVLFVCSGNIGRSQIAMEYFRSMTSDLAESAGTRVTVPGEKIGNREDAQAVLLSMKEENIDMSQNKRTVLTPDMLDDFDKVVVMAEPDRTPEWLSSSPKFIYWNIANVNGLPIEQVRIIRDEIKQKVERLLH
jgi:protein-tyrosine-phosphatase